MIMLLTCTHNLYVLFFSLEEYLQELAGLSSPSGVCETGITPNEQRQGSSSKEEVPNFTHAALILQNSSHVYSRKVEYLHTLVYKALQEFFQSTATGNKSNSSRRKSADSDVDAFFEFDPHENFLLLDDVVPEDTTRSKINLKDDDETGDDYNSPEDDTPFSSRRRNRSFSSVTSKNNTCRLSWSGLSNTRLERNSLGGRFSFSPLQQQRALLGILNNGSLRLIDGQCDVDDSGALLMPGSQTNRNEFNLDGGSAGRESLDDFASGKPRSLFEIDSDNTKNYSERMSTWDDFHDDDNDGPGFVMNDEVDEDEAQTLDPTPCEETFKKVTFEEHTEKKKTKNIKNNPWELLDPYSIDDPSYLPKPFKKGKTFRLPEGISQKPSECVTGARTRRITQPQMRPLIFSKARPSLAVESLRVAMGEQLESRVKITNLGLQYGNEFKYVAKENAKLKAAKRRQGRKRQQELAGKGNQFIDPEWIAGTDYDDVEDDFGGTNAFTGVDDDNDYDDDVDNEGGNAGFNSVDDVIQETQYENYDGTFTEL
jgi:hypothetical protein